MIFKAKNDIILERKKGIYKNEFYIDWDCERGCFGLDGNYFKWNTRFIKDLLILKELAVRVYKNGKPLTKKYLFRFSIAIPLSVVNFMD